jgi:hypothetical protein
MTKKLTKDELKKLISEALGPKLPGFDQVASDRSLGGAPLPPKESPADYSRKHTARAGAGERWLSELRPVLGKIRAELENNPEWNDGSRVTQVRKQRVMSAINALTSALVKANSVTGVE